MQERDRDDGDKVTSELDFGAQRGFPGAANHDVENSGGGGDNDQKNGEELEEDAVLHVLLI